MTKEQHFLKDKKYHQNVTVVNSDVELLLKEYANQQLTAERKRYDELKAKYDSLVLDNCTLEYNAEESRRHLPELINQYVDCEREKAANLVEAIKSIALKMGHTWPKDELLKIIHEYNANTSNG